METLRYRYCSGNDIETVCSQILNLCPPRIGFDIESSTCNKAKQVDLLILAIPDSYLDSFDVSEFKEIPFRKSQNITLFLLHRPTAQYTSLLEIMKNRHIIKIGCGIDNDLLMTKRTLKIWPSPVLDIQHLELSQGYRSIGLGALGQKYLGVKKEKSNHYNTNWISSLTEKQIRYAVFDGYLTLAIYQKMMHIDSSSSKLRDRINQQSRPFKAQTKIGKFYKSENQKQDNLYEIEEVIYFLRRNMIFASKRPPAKKKIINILVNSYDGFKGIHPSRSRKIAHDAIDQCQKKGYLIETNNSYQLAINSKPKDYSSLVSVEELTNHLKKHNSFPMKRSSIIQQIMNSSYLKSIPIPDRIFTSDSILDSLLETKLFGQNGEFILSVLSQGENQESDDSEDIWSTPIDNW